MSIAANDFAFALTRREVDACHDGLELTGATVVGAVVVGAGTGAVPAAGCPLVFASSGRVTNGGAGPPFAVSVICKQGEERFDNEEENFQMCIIKTVCIDYVIGVNLEASRSVVVLSVFACEFSIFQV